jgi:hypothetical protein
MQELVERFETQCSRVFEAGPDILNSLTGEMDGSFVTKSEDGNSFYFVWLTDDYTRGMTVIVIQGTEGAHISCGVSYGNYEIFDPEGAEAALREVQLESRDIAITGGAMRLVAGSEERLHALYTSEPIRYLSFTGLFANESILAGGEINHVGTVNLSADIEWLGAPEQ